LLFSFATLACVLTCRAGALEPAWSELRLAYSACAVRAVDVRQCELFAFVDLPNGMEGGFVQVLVKGEMHVRNAGVVDSAAEQENALIKHVCDSNG
jgi:hypothetical protein